MSIHVTSTSIATIRGSTPTLPIKGVCFELVGKIPELDTLEPVTGTMKTTSTEVSSFSRWTTQQLKTTGTATSVRSSRGSIALIARTGTMSSKPFRFEIASIQWSSSLWTKLTLVAKTILTMRLILVLLSAFSEDATPGCTESTTITWSRTLRWWSKSTEPFTMILTTPSVGLTTGMTLSEVGHTEPIPNATISKVSLYRSTST